jgi:uncharacterized protein (TIGR01777 family)
MRIVIAGGSGFLGSRLSRALEARGADVVILTRAAGAGGGHRITWNPDGTVGSWAAAIEGADAVVNLAGTSIAGKRWTPQRKQEIRDSRVQATRSLAAAIAGASSRPRAFISGSAVGYYGALDDRRVTETAPPGTDFLARVCVEWEKEAATATGTRIVMLRTGLVLAREGGALPQMLPPFRFGAGGPVGSGRQYWPWIHADDWTALAVRTIEDDAIEGPVNLTAPAPVTSAEFARALGRAMHRPAFIPAPAFALRLLFGEMADSLLLSGQRAVPDKAERAGFTFQYRAVDGALQALFRRPEP